MNNDTGLTKLIDEIIASCRTRHEMEQMARALLNICTFEWLFCEHQWFSRHCGEPFDLHVFLAPLLFGRLAFVATGQPKIKVSVRDGQLAIEEAPKLPCSSLN